MKARTMLVAASAAVLLLAACDGAGEGSGGTADDIRTIEVETLDELTFEPASIEVQSGETVRFVVTNDGQVTHDFYVGSEEEQMAHEAAMGGMDHGSETTTEALTLDAGETEELTVTFDEPGNLLFGCHQPGHYAGGMVGTITVT